MLLTNLGIQTEIRPVDTKLNFPMMVEGKYDIAFGGWGGDYTHPMTFLELFTSTAYDNATGWANPEYDDLIAKARVATDEAEALDLMVQAEHILDRRKPDCAGLRTVWRADDAGLRHELVHLPRRYAVHRRGRGDQVGFSNCCLRPLDRVHGRSQALFGNLAFDDHPWAAVSCPSMSVVRQPTHQIGQVAAEMILSLIDGRPVPEKRVVLPCELVVRQIMPGKNT